MLTRENRYAKNNSAARKEQQIQQLVPTHPLQHIGPRRGSDRKDKQRQGRTHAHRTTGPACTSTTEHQVPQRGGGGRGFRKEAPPFNFNAAHPDRPRTKTTDDGTQINTAKINIFISQARPQLLIQRVNQGQKTKIMAKRRSCSSSELKEPLNSF